MNETLKEDMHYVISRLPKSVVEIMKKFNLYLSGGFIRSIISGEKPSDIDLFGKNEGIIIEAVDYLTKYKWSDSAHITKTDNAFTIISVGRLPVQFITRWLYDDPVKLINEFDFTITQAVIWFSHTESYSNNQNEQIDSYKPYSICSPFFYSDLAAKRLRYTSPDRKEDAGGSILRVVKFLRRGYNIAPEDLSKVICQLLKGVKDNVDLRDKYLCKILTGLMREVDPLRLVDGCEVNTEMTHNEIE